PLREITLHPTERGQGRAEPNEPVRVYDCSGPWGDEAFLGSVRQGLPPLRQDWILRRGDVEAYDGRLHRTEQPGPMPQRRPLRAKAGRVVTQLQYARQGIITPEMEFIAI